jgi:D-beta-D-heptose 7-phosphate kinase/D-beta-D-heptose 1-phosphate adenosyltransferase
MRIVLCTGGFDPLHSGHIAYFKAARELGQKLIVGINSDNWLTRKKGRPFMPWHERAAIIKELKFVDDVIDFDDSDNSANLAIFKCAQRFPNSKIVFANGGDRINDNTPEYKIYGKMPWVEFVWGVGGSNKANSSSVILEQWKKEKTVRPWGWYRVLEEKQHYKVKELVIDAGKSLSDQKHNYRNERWYVLKGECTIDTEWNNIKNTITIKELTHDYIINSGMWHRAYNNTDHPCYILEVQFGEKCVETDIERRN